MLWLMLTVAMTDTAAPTPPPPPSPSPPPPHTSIPSYSLCVTYVFHCTCSLELSGAWRLIYAAKFSGHCARGVRRTIERPARIDRKQLQDLCDEYWRGSTNCFLHKSWRAQPCLGNLDVSQWMLGAALTHRFGHLDLEPNDFWTRQVDGADRGHQGQEERDRETGD